MGSIIQIRKAVREAARLVIGLSSVSGDGKTFTAIQLAYGLANYRADKVGLLDAENRRGSLYADILQQATRPTNDQFLIADLHPPFSPQRYGDAIMEFQKAGVEVLIVDSTTHEWEGSGGCQEIAEAGNPKVPNWNRAKGEHKKFMNVLLQCDMHIIVCVRAREKAKPERINGKVEFVDLGLQPIQEKNFMFEMTASLMMHEQGKRQTILKCPAALLNILGRREGYITADDGHALRQWVDGALKLDPTVEKYRNRLISNTEGGVKHIIECWEKTPADVRAQLGDDFRATIVAAAKGYDDQKALVEATRDETDRIELDASTTGNASTATAAETAEAEAIAARAREAAAKAPVTNAAQQTPAQQATTVRGSLATPDDMASSAARTQATASAEKPASKVAEKPKPAASATPAKTAAPPQQKELAAPVTGVLDSDPVF